MTRKPVYNLLEGFANLGMKILRKYDGPHNNDIKIRHIVLAVGLYSFYFINKCSDKNPETYQQNPIEICTNDTTNPYIISRNNKYVNYADSLDKLISDTHANTKNEYLPLPFNLKENTFKPLSPNIMSEYNIFKIPKSTLPRNNQ